MTTGSPLVSVIIPCYNHGRYLGRALDSVLTQPYPSVEVIVVDDGSTDETEDVCSSYPQVKYIRQSNAGLSAARNTGIENSTGQYLVFLDADDWLLNNALGINAAFLEHDKSLGFVSGGYLLSRQGSEEPVRRRVNSDHYLHLLRGNYISMHATVMYNRKVFRSLRYDTSLRACEDYDIYLQVAREYPVLHHNQLLAAYWHHDTNMSSDLSLMLEFSLKALEKQRPLLRSTAEKQAYEQGVKNWKQHYSENMYAALVRYPSPLTGRLKKKFLHALRQVSPYHYFKYILLLPLKPLRKFNKPKVQHG